LTSYYLGASKIIAKLLSKYTAKGMFISLWMVVAHDDVGTTTSTFLTESNKPGSVDIFLYTFIKGNNAITKGKVLEFGSISADVISSIHVSGGTHYSDYYWLSTSDIRQIETQNRQSDNSTFRAYEYGYPSLFVTGFVEREIVDDYKVETGDITDGILLTINKLNSYSNIYGDDNVYDSFIAKFSHERESPTANYRIDWFKYLDFNGNESHNNFDINSEGELIMGINIDNSSSVDGASYIIKYTDNGTIIN